MEKDKPASQSREHDCRPRGGLNLEDYQALTSAVGPENLAKLWLLATQTFGSEFSLDQCLSLANQATKPDRAVFHEMPLMRPDTLYINNQGGYSLSPICHTQSGLNYG
jgi:hypothetical protein